MGDEVEEYIAGGIEITLDESSETNVLEVVLLGTDFQYRLDGRPVTIRKR